MPTSTKDRYQGCLATPPLWEGTAVSPYLQIALPYPAAVPGAGADFKAKRLGKLVEAFIYHALKQDSSVSWIADGLQVQEGKRTLGEIDALFYHREVPVHLEVAYKFYLYDNREQYEAPLAPWIGPNRKDRLVLKLDKLHKRQFPLLGSEQAARYLEQYGLEFEQLQQRLCFKGQLFLPFEQQEMEVGALNPDCVAGFYLRPKELEAFRRCSFFIPQKKDWLARPNPQVDWLDYAEAREALQAEIMQRRSPMVWVRSAEGGISKCFVVFW